MDYSCTAVYVDVGSNTCVDLTFQFGTIPMGGAATNRMWSIKVIIV